MSSGLAGSGNLVSPGDQQRVDLRSLLSAVMTKAYSCDRLVTVLLAAGDPLGDVQREAPPVFIPFPRCISTSRLPCLNRSHLHEIRFEQHLNANPHQLTRQPPGGMPPTYDSMLLRSGRWDGELEKTRADGTWLVVSARWSLRRDEQGRPAAILATNNDITERKRREQKILTLNEELGKRSLNLRPV